MTKYLFSALIVTGPGLWRISELTLEEAKKLVSDGAFISAVGHPATAELLSQLLGVQVIPNRIEANMNKGDIAVVFKLVGRLPEGKILSLEELKQLQYKFYLIERLE